MTLGDISKTYLGFRTRVAKFATNTACGAFVGAFNET